MDATEHKPPAGVAVLALWVPEDRRRKIGPDSYGVAEYSRIHGWHEHGDTDNQYRDADYWARLPDPPLREVHGK